MMISFCFSGCDPKKISISQIMDISSADTLDGKIYRFDFFLITNYVDNLKTGSFVDSFISVQKGDNPLKFYQYDMIFYKESNITTLANVKADKKIIDRYSQEHDLVFSFSWSKGRLVSKMKFINGKLVEPQYDIRIEDIRK